jgi:hypothetical protein
MKNATTTEGAGGTNHKVKCQKCQQVFNNLQGVLLHHHEGKCKPKEPDLNQILGKRLKKTTEQKPNAPKTRTSTIRRETINLLYWNLRHF